MPRDFEIIRGNRYPEGPDDLLGIYEDTGMHPRLLRNGRVREEPENDPTNWLRAVNVLKKHWKLSAVFATAVIATVVTVTFLMKPIYEPVARIEVDPPGTEIFSLQGGNSATTDAEYMETQAQNLQSDALALAVIHRLHLDQSAVFVGDLLKKGKVGQGVAPDGTRLTPAENAALRSFKSRLNVKRDTGSRLIMISFASGDPQLSSTVVNTLLSEFVEISFRTRHDAIMQSTEWLSRQLDDIKKKMEDSNKALADFQRQTGIAPVDDNKSTFTEEMADLQKQYTQAQADRIQLEALLHRVKEATPDTLPQVNANPVVQQLTQKLAEAKAELAQQSVVYGKNHPNVIKLQHQVDTLQSQLNAQRENILSELKTSYAAAKAREGLMSGQMRGTTKQLNEMAQYNALKKEAQANSELYNSLYAKVKEAGIAAASKSSNIRVIDQARVLDSPTRPHRIFNIAVGMLAGIFGGMVLAFVKEGFDNRIHNTEDIRRYTGISAVSILPIMNTQPGMSESKRLRLVRKGERFGVAEKFLLERPHSPEAEAMRGLHTSIMLSRRGRPPQAVLIASSFPAEGKTTVAVNLAIALAQHGRTCLLDADLRRSGVAGAFGLKYTQGLGDVLIGAIPVEDVFLDVPEVPNLVILPAGPASPNPAQLVCSDQMKDLVRSLRRDFDFVVIDSPPILPYADGRALSPLVDGVVFVGRAGVTTREAMVRSMQLLSEVNAAPVIEVVLNAADINVPDYRYYKFGYN